MNNKQKNILFPNDFLAEKSLIASLIVNQNCFDDIGDVKIAPEDFYDKRFKIIFGVIVELQKQNLPVDYVTISSRLNQISMLEVIGGTSFLLELVDNYITDINAYGYAIIVKEYSSLRNIISTSLEIANDGLNLDKAFNEYIKDVETKYFNLTSKNQVNKLASIFSLLKENIKDLENTSRKPGEIDGLTTGFATLDKILMGLREGQLLIIGARPGMGKSALAMNIAYHACVQSGLPIIYFSLEMPGKELSMRLLTSVSKVQNHKVKMKNFEDQDLRRLSKATGELSKIPIYIDDTSAISLATIISICRKKKIEEGLGLVVIDYLQLMGVNKQLPREQQISEISRGLKAMAKDLECPVIALSQLNRESESGNNKGGNKRPTMSNLRESGAIEQDADIIMLIYRDDYYNKDTKEPGIAEVIVTKNRNGEQDTAKLGWVGAYTSFENLNFDYKK